METIKDIVKQMRYGMIPKHRHDHELLWFFADRIDKAVTNCNQFKLRAALTQAQRLLHCAIVADILKGEDAIEILNEVNAALNEPPRYCDVMSLDTGRKVWFSKEILPRLAGDLPLGKETPFEEWFVSQMEQ